MGTLGSATTSVSGGRAGHSSAVVWKCLLVLIALAAGACLVSTDTFAGVSGGHSSAASPKTKAPSPSPRLPDPYRLPHKAAYTGTGPGTQEAPVKQQAPS